MTVGVFAFNAAQHGALWVAYKTMDEVRTQARGIARIAWFAAMLTIVVPFSASRYNRVWRRFPDAGRLCLPPWR